MRRFQRVYSAATGRPYHLICGIFPAVLGKHVACLIVKDQIKGKGQLQRTSQFRFCQPQPMIQRLFQVKGIRSGPGQRQDEDPIRIRFKEQALEDLL